MEQPGYWQRKFSRRRLLRSTVIGGSSLAAAAVIGCGDDDEATPSPTAAAPSPGPATGAPAASPTPGAQQPKRGGILTSGNFTVDPPFDPHTDSVNNALQMRLMYQALLRYDLRTFEVQPELAQKWEQPSPTEFIFTLQPGVKFHNKAPASGRPMTAGDVVFSLERVRTDNPRFTSRVLLDGMKIEAVNPTTVKITTPRPDAPILSKLAGDALVILAKEVLEKEGAASEPGKINTVESAVGTGPFMLKSFQERVNSEYARHPDYWKQGLPYLDTVRRLALHAGHGNERGWAAFLAGEADIINVPGSQIKNYISRQGPGYTPDWGGDVAPYSSVPNTQVPPFSDSRVTKALRLIIDHDEYIKAWAEVWGGKGAHGSVLPANLESWDIPQDEYKTHLEWKQPKDQGVKEALELLSAAGFTKDKPLQFELTGINKAAVESFAAGAELLDAQFRRLGQGVIQTQLRPLDISAYQTVRAKRDYTFAWFSNAASFNDPDAWWDTAYRTGAGRNYWNYGDPELDTMFDKQKTMFKIDERRAYTKDIIRKMVERWPGIICSQLYALSAKQPEVQGFRPEVWFSGFQYEEVWKSV